MRPRTRPAASPLALLALASLPLAGCGSSPRISSPPSSSSSVPSYVHEPFTAKQQLIAAGARLIVSDGCSACHLDGSSSRLGPSFESFAGHEVTLASGRRVLVDEAFLQAGLREPAAHALRGYSAAPMLRALAPLHLASHPHDVEALAAFVEEVGPE